MSTPTISALVAGMVTVAGVPAVPVSAVAAELLPPAVAHVRHHHATLCCGSLRLPSRKSRLPQGIAIDLRP